MQRRRRRTSDLLWVASSFYDGKEISDGTEDTVPFLEKCPFGLYGETKRQALQMVIKENGSMLENGKFING